MSNINIITPKDGVDSPYNNCIVANKDKNFSSIIELSEEDVDVLEFFKPIEVQEGVLKVSLDFSPNEYIQYNNIIKLIDKCNAITGTTIENAKRDDNQNQYFEGNNIDYSGLIFIPKSVNLEIKVSENKAIAIIGNNIVTTSQMFSIPANTYVPVRFILGTNGSVFTNYNKENIFYSFII